MDVVRGDEANANNSQDHHHQYLNRLLGECHSSTARSLTSTSPPQTESHFLIDLCQEEVIDLTPRNTRQMIFYVHPKLLPRRDKSVEQQVTTVSSHVSDPVDITSELDVDLALIFENQPPVTSMSVVQFKKPSGGRINSAENVCSYRGTADLQQMGNASYFSDVLDPAENRREKSRKSRLKQFLAGNCNFWKFFVKCSTKNDNKMLANAGPASSPDIPEPIMAPVLTRHDKRWFFGSAPPDDHKKLIQSQQLPNHLNYFSK